MQATSSSPGERSGRIPPSPTIDSQFYWERASKGELVLQKCRTCQQLTHPPLPMCPNDLSRDWEYITSSGRGYIFSYVRVYHPRLPEFDYPNLVGIVELDEGVRVVAGLVEFDEHQVEIGARVDAVFIEVEPGLVLPHFRPA
jgi:uncharacterized OB-fold protein